MDIFTLVDEKKKIIDSCKLFDKQNIDQIKKYFKIELTWSSNALDKNNITTIETKVLLEDELSIGGRSIEDTFKILGHGKAFDFMFSLCDLNTILEEDLLMMHKLYYCFSDFKYSGIYRKQDIYITGSKYAVCRKQLVQDEMNKLLLWIKNERNNYHPIEFSALLHKKFVFIQPFICGNGIIARLLMNLVLIQNEYLMAIIPPSLRKKYISLLEYSHVNDIDFITFIAERVLQTEEEVMKLLNL